MLQLFFRLCCHSAEMPGVPGSRPSATPDVLWLMLCCTYALLPCTLRRLVALQGRCATACPASHGE